MKKSTRVLLILLGCLIFISGVLLLVFRHEIFAETPTPDPKTTETEAGQDREAQDKTPSTGECKSAFDEGDPNQPVVDSGLTMWIECKTVDQVNAAPLNGDKYTLSFNYRFAFTERCSEYISEPKMYWQAGVSEPLDPGKVPSEISIGNDQTATYSGTLTHEFTLGERYGYSFGLPIWEGAILWEGAQGELMSNGCYIRKMVNKKETKGEEIKKAVDDKATTGGVDEKCKNECRKQQDCGTVDPICNGFCSMTCAMLDLMAGAFNFAFGILHTAVGLS